MGVQSFIQSAKILYDSQEYEEALCLACSAIDAYATEHYPEKRVGERYKTFLKANFSTICKYGFPEIQASNIRIKVDTPIANLKTDKDGYVDMGQIIYHVLRCSLVHECNIEKTIQFTKHRFYTVPKMNLHLIK